jgi:hypothetical protein
MLTLGKAICFGPLLGERTRVSEYTTHIISGLKQGHRYPFFGDGEKPCLNQWITKMRLLTLKW